MKFDLERRIVFAIRRVHFKIDDQARHAKMVLENLASQAQGELHEAFNTAARSIGQSRRQRNQRAQAQ